MSDYLRLLTTRPAAPPGGSWRRVRRTGVLGRLIRFFRLREEVWVPKS